MKITIGNLVCSAELNDSMIAKKLAASLPVRSTASIWGDEIYFRIPVKERITRPVSEVQVGDVAYWPSGACFCIFFGPTPVSPPGKIVPASEVEIIGKVAGADPEALRQVKEGETVLLEK